MKTLMKNLTSIKSMPVLTLILLVVLVSSFVKSPAQDPVSVPVNSAENTGASSIAGNLHATISIYSVEDDIAAIEEFMDLYALSMTTGDLELHTSLYTDDTVKMVPDVPAMFGKEEVRAGMKPLIDNFTIEEMAIFDVVIQLAGDWAFTRCNFTVTMIPKAGGEPLYMDAKDMSIMQRQADGSWKIYWDCWNSNVPPTPTTVE